VDKKTLYDKAEKAFNQAFEVTKQSVKVISEKAGEAANVTKLLLQKATLEHRVTKQFAQLGNRVYEQAVRKGESVSSEDVEIKKIIEDTKKLDVELAQTEAELEKEKKSK